MDEIVNLIGGEDVGLPLPQELLHNGSRLQCIDITDMTNKPVVGDYCKDGLFYKQPLGDDADAEAL